MFAGRYPGVHIRRMCQVVGFMIRSKNWKGQALPAAPRHCHYFFEPEEEPAETLREFLFLLK
jgi:hypothetical protein